MDGEDNRVEFFDKDMEYAYLTLRESDPQLFSRITRAIEDLRSDRRAGRPAPKWFIPPRYRNASVNNIWRYDLPNGWRLLYTITGSHIQILIIILDWMSHKEYERLVGLKGGRRR